MPFTSAFFFVHGFLVDETCFYSLLWYSLVLLSKELWHLSMLHPGAGSAGSTGQNTSVYLWVRTNGPKERETEGKRKRNHTADL